MFRVSLTVRALIFRPTAVLAQHWSPIKLDQLEKGIPNIRNIGIVAHIDAGKTTTTERMLFYAGVTKRVGDVDSGTTTTDYMQEEMERGITITSAAVSLKWKECTINLIDTPGHVDFTVEVERALRVVDGVVALFDASAGVQAQSYTVLRQARKFNTPVIAFLNKMDKPNANFSKSVKSIQDKLQVETLVVQLPILGEDGAFEGVIDVVDMKALRFGGKNGSDVHAAFAAEALPAYVVSHAKAARHELIAQLTNRDDALGELFIEALDRTSGDEEAAEAQLASTDIRSCIRRLVVTADPKAVKPMVPVLCGASRRDIGVQPLLDAVNHYLPSPLDRKDLMGFAEDGSRVPYPPVSNMPDVPTVALAFKVIHQQGSKGSFDPLVFFRVYSGKITPKCRLTNHCQPNKPSELFEKLYVMHANQPVEVPVISAGNIGAAFLPKTCTGDTLYAEPTAQRLHAKAPVEVGESVLPLRTLEGIEAPPPAISYSIEAANAKSITLMDEALASLMKEDPSLRTSKNDFGQLVISGMGELHLEIIMSRMEREFNLRCKLLRAIIEYRETIVKPSTHTKNRVVVNELPFFDFDVEILPMMLDGESELDPSLKHAFEVSPECAEAFLNPEGAVGHGNEKARNLKDDLDIITTSFKNAMEDCCRLGPLAGIPLIGCKVVLTKLHKRVLTFTDRQINGPIRATLAEVLQNLPKKHLVILEPMMAVEVHLTEPTFVGDVIASLNEKNAVTVDILEDGRSVAGVVPMRNIVRYTTDLRKSAKGNANFYTKLSYYRIVEDKMLLGKILKNLGVQ